MTIKICRAVWPGGHCLRPAVSRDLCYGHYCQNKRQRPIGPLRGRRGTIGARTSSFRLAHGQIERLHARSAQERTTPAELVRRAIGAYLAGATPPAERGVFLPSGMFGLQYSEKENPQ